jgi:diguanylate cyclase (GGDEF)-like protein
MGVTAGGLDPTASGFAVRTAGVMLVVGGSLTAALAAAAHGAPGSVVADTRTQVIAASAAAVGLGMVLLLLRRRTPAPLLFAIPSVAVVLICLPALASHQAMPIGAILLVWPILFAGYLMPERVAWLTLWVALVVLTAVAVRIHTGAGSAQCAEVAASLVATYYVMVHLRRHVNELVSALHREARTDPLTHLANRRAFDGFLDRELALYERHGDPLSLLVIDIDHFKRLNDRAGHPAGDAALVELAGILTGHVRRSDLVARIGGEEFAVLFTDCDTSQAQQRAHALRDAVATESGAWPHPITVSIGLATVPDNAGTAGQLITAADTALYSAKAAGRDTVATA